MKAIVWRGITLRPEPGAAGMYRSEQTRINDYRTADWKAHQAGATWYARLRVGADRFPGRGDTAEAALDAALAEARLIARFIRAMSPKGGA